jgi:hypothetical protein
MNSFYGVLLMNSTQLRHLRAWLALAIAVIFSQICHADLFALFTTGDIARINSTTGAVIDTYPGIGNASINSGLTFDGQRLYLNRRSSSIWQEIWAFEIETKTWMPYGSLDTFNIDPAGPNFLSGLGYAPGPFGEGSLVTVSRRQTDHPSYITEFLFFPPFGGPLLSLPSAPLPPDIDALGADYDPATGEFWISAERVEMSTRTPVLLRAELTGNIEEELLPSLATAAIPRGLAFDSGEMFIGVRHLPTVTNEIHKIDRVTGAVLDSFVISGNGSVVALAGGKVIPEPATAVLCAMIVLLGVNRRQ